MHFLDKYNGSRLTAALLSGLYPSTCPVCHRPSDNLLYAPICENCWNTIQKYTGPACGICAAPLVSDYSIKCSECTAHKPGFSSVENYGLYSDTLREAIHILKFSGFKRLAKPLGRFLSELRIPEADGIVPVPLSKKSLRQRGFNQTLLLARVLSMACGIPVQMDVLHKKKDTLPQIGLGAKDRAANVKDAFEVNADITGLRLILLDDVMTTGATVRECSKALVKAGAKVVVAVTLARAVME